MSTRKPSSGIIHESTIPIAKPRPAFGMIRWNIVSAHGILKQDFKKVEIFGYFLKKLKLTAIKQNPIIMSPKSAAFQRPIL